MGLCLKHGFCQWINGSWIAQNRDHGSEKIHVFRWLKNGSIHLFKKKWISSKTWINGLKIKKKRSIKLKHGFFFEKMDFSWKKRIFLTKHGLENLKFLENTDLS